MKNFLALLCVILSIIECAQGEDDEFLAGECRIDGKVYKVDENFTKPGKCLLYTCRGSEGYGAVTCPYAVVLPHCKFTAQDNSNPYPECCPKIIC